MSIADFKAEFSVLLKRFAIVTSPTDESSKGLSHQVLLNAIQDTIRTVLNVKLQYLEEASMRTPANNEIVVATPDAPDVQRIDYNQSIRFESFKSFTDSENEFKLPNFNGVLHTHIEEKVEVSDNENTGDNVNNNNKDLKNANLSTSGPKEHAFPKLTLKHIVDETQQNVQKVMCSLQRMAEILKPESRSEPHAVRRLSTIINSSSSSSSTSSAAKKSMLSQSVTNHRSTTIQRGKLARRSLAAASATDDVVTTPTTSRPSLGNSNTLMTTTKKSVVASVSKLAQHSISASFSNDKQPKSPVKLTKNPKYAHVQSTIPKSTVAKKNNNKV